MRVFRGFSRFCAKRSFGKQIPRALHAYGAVLKLNLKIRTKCGTLQSDSSAQILNFFFLVQAPSRRRPHLSTLYFTPNLSVPEGREGTLWEPSKP
jgi:hypothetical protein